MGKPEVEVASSPPQSKRPFQFRLMDVLVGTAWLAGLLAIVTQVRPVQLCSLLVLGWGAIPLVVARRRGLISLGQAAVVWSAIVFPIGFLVPAVWVARQAGQRTYCVNNLHQIALALHAYENTYGCLPPAYIADANGKPMHSWRVLILPFMSNSVLYNMYRMNEPWDGPNNKKLHSYFREVYCCPSDRQNGRGVNQTNYVAVVGPGTAWPGTTSVKYDMVRDGLSNTILLVEVANSGLHWMEPRDLPASALNAGINPPNAVPGSAISSEHPTVVVAAFMDGRVQALDETTPVDALHALFTIRGGENLQGDGSYFTLMPPRAKPQAAPQQER